MLKQTEKPLVVWFHYGSHHVDTFWVGKQASLLEFRGSVVLQDAQSGLWRCRRHRPLRDSSAVQKSDSSVPADVDTHVSICVLLHESSFRGCLRLFGRGKLSRGFPNLGKLSSNVADLRDIEVSAFGGFLVCVTKLFTVLLGHACAINNPVWENFKPCARQSVVQQSAVPKDNSSDTTWTWASEIREITLLANTICWFCFRGWTLAKRKLHKALVCLALFETCFSACGTRDRYPFLLSLVKHISKAEKYLGKPLDKTFQVWDQYFFPRQPAPSFCAWLWRFVCYLFCWQRLEIGVEDQFQRFPISVLWWLCPNSFSFLFPSQKHNGVGLGVFVALPGQSTIRCFGRLGAGEGTKLPILTTITPWILHTLVFVWKVSRFRRSLSWLKLQTAATRRTKMHRKERMWSVWFVHFWSFWFPRTGTRELIVFKMFYVFWYFSKLSQGFFLKMWNQTDLNLHN